MKTATLLDRIVIEPEGPATGSVIWLHGLGASGHDFESALPFLQLKPNHGIRFIFPHAKKMPVGLNGGMRMPAWYDLNDLELTRNQDEVGIRKSEQYILELIENEVESGIASEHIVLMGFSQGSAMALHTALRYHKRLAGVGFLSGYIVLEDALKKELSEQNKKIPIFVAHGSLDPVVPFVLGEHAYSLLKKLGYQAEFQSYPMAHMVCMEELVDVGRWVQSVIPSA